MSTESPARETRATRNLSSSGRGLDLKPGSVRRAREEAGLSLAEVASGKVSRVAIHKIEKGASRPTLETLRLIAERTNKPLSFFLLDGQPPVGAAVQRTLNELELLLAQERFIELEPPARDFVDHCPEPGPRALARLYLSQAIVRRGEAEEALALARSARAYFESAADGYLTVDAMDWEAVALFMLQAPEALPLARSALAACRQLDPVPAAMLVRILGHLGMIHVSRREWAETISYYEEAAEAAEGVRDLGRLAHMYHNMAIAYNGLGELGRAGSYFQKATTLFEMRRDRANIARTFNNLGRLYLKQGRHADAEQAVRRALDELAAVGMQHGRAQFLLTLAEVHLAQGRYAECEQRVAEAERQAAQVGERISGGDGRVWRGRLAAARGQDALCDQEFQAAMAIFHAEQATERLAECHVEYARILRERDDAEGAYVHMEEAVALGRPHLARRQAWAAYMAG